MTDGGGVSVRTFWEDADEDDALQQYRTLVNTVQDGIYQLDAEGRIVAVNDAIVELTGYDREALLGEPASRFVDGADCERIEREIGRRLADDDEAGEPLDLTVETAGGGTVPCELQLNLLLEDGILRGSTGVVRGASERRRAERSLRAHERRLQRERDLNDRILEASPVGIMILDGDGEVDRIDHRGREILGVDDLEAYSLADVTTYDEDGNRLAVDEHPFAETLRDGEPVDDRILRVELPDGDRRWLSVSATAVRAEDGELERVVVTGEDVTELKERERDPEARRAELQRERAELERRTEELSSKLERIYGRITDGVVAVDESWRFTHVNERAEEILGIDGEALLGENAWETHSEVLGTDIETYYREAMETGEPVSFEVYFEPYDAWFEERVYPSETGLSIYFRDVTDRKTMEQELREERDLVEGIVETSPDGITVADEAGEMVFANERAEEILGRPREEITEFSHDDPRWDLVDEDGDPLDADETPFALVLERSEPVFDTVVGVRRPSGARVWLSVNGAPRFVDGEPTGAVFTLQDVTDQRRMESELQDILGRVTDAFYALDEEFRFTHVNERAAELLRRDEADLLGETLWEVFPEAAEIDEVWDAFHTAMETQEPRSYELYFEPLGFWVRATVHPSETGVSVYFQDVTERKEYQRELAARNRFNDAVRTTSVAAATATSRDEIEERVCAQLVEMEPLALAWISHLERGQSTVTPAAAAGVDDGYLDDLTITVDDSERGSGPTGRAVRTGEPQFVHDVRTDPSFAPWREAAEERGFRSSAALPIAHEGATYGVLNVYATEPGAFEGAEGEMLVQLSELVGHAVHAVEQRKALVSDSVTELELAIRDDEDPLFDATTDRDASLTVDRRVPASGDRYVNFVTVRNVDRETFRAIAEERPYVSGVECLAANGDEHRFEITMTELPISEVLAAHGGRLRELAMTDGTFRLIAEVPPDADVREILETLRDRFTKTELLAQRTSVRDQVTVRDLEKAVLERLTEKQRAALEAAYFAGYFEWPRVTSGQEVADLLGVSPATFTQHLRNAELKLFEAVLEERSATA